MKTADKLLALLICLWQISSVGVKAADDGASAAESLPSDRSNIVLSMAVPLFDGRVTIQAPAKTWHYSKGPANNESYLRWELNFDADEIGISAKDMFATAGSNFRDCVIRHLQNNPEPLRGLGPEDRYPNWFKHPGYIVLPEIESDDHHLRLIELKARKRLPRLTQLAPETVGSPGPTGDFEELDTDTAPKRKPRKNDQPKTRWFPDLSVGHTWFACAKDGRVFKFYTYVTPGIESSIQKRLQRRRELQALARRMMKSIVVRTLPKSTQNPVAVMEDGLEIKVPQGFGIYDSQRYSGSTDVCIVPEPPVITFVKPTSFGQRHSTLSIFYFNSPKLDQPPVFSCKMLGQKIRWFAGDEPFTVEALLPVRGYRPIRLVIDAADEESLCQFKHIAENMQLRPPPAASVFYTRN